MFSCEYCEILRTPILKNFCKRLLLKYRVFPQIIYKLELLYDRLLKKSSVSLQCHCNFNHKKRIKEASTGGVLQKRYSLKTRETHRITPVSTSLFQESSDMPGTSLKIDSNTGVFLRILRTFKESGIPL